MHQDFKELLSAFNAGQVRYLIVGGYAVSYHAQPRATKDLDILIGAQGREDWLNLRQQQTREKSQDPPDRSAEKDQDAKRDDVSGSPEKGLHDDLS